VTDFPKEYILFLQGLREINVKLNNNEQAILEKEELAGQEGSNPPIQPKTKRGVKLNG